MRVGGPDEPTIDCHSHVFDPARFRYASDAYYLPSGQEVGTPDQLTRVFDAHGVRHAVLVGPNSGYGDAVGLFDAVCETAPGFVMAHITKAWMFARIPISGLRPSPIFSTAASCIGSQGNALEITPGAMNIMTAGRGIAHSERSPLSARRAPRDYSVSKAGSRFRRRMRKPTRLFSISTPQACPLSRTVAYGPG